MGLNIPSKTRRASQQGAKKALWLFDRSEFQSVGPLREAQGSPQGRVLWAFSFGHFSCTHKKSDKAIQKSSQQ